MRMKHIPAALMLALLAPIGVEAQIYPVCGDFQVSEIGTGVQTSPGVAMDAAGNFVVIWTDASGRDGSRAGIFGRVFNADGTPRSGDFQVTQRWDGPQWSASVAMDAVGNFVVVWADTGAGDGWGSGIFGRRFAADGNPITDEFQVNSQITGSQNGPDIAMRPDGRFVVVWSGIGAIGTDTTAHGVFGRLFDATGDPEGDQFVVAGPDMEGSLSVALDDDGDITVAFEDCCPGSAWAIYGQRLDQYGNPLGLTFQVSQGGSYNRLPYVGVDGLGNALFIWGAGARRYDTSVTPIGDVFCLGPTSAYCGGSDLGMRPDGQHLVTFGEYRDKIIVKEFDESGILVGGPVQANRVGTKAYFPTSIGFTGDRSVVAWIDSGRDGDGYGIFARRLMIGVEPPANNPPDAADDFATTDEGASVGIDVLANDTDVDGDPLTIDAVTQGVHGTVVISAGTVTYTPDPGFSGADSFTYTIGDSGCAFDTATVYVTVNPLNSPPAAVDDTLATDEDTPLVVSAPGVLGNDTDADYDPLTAALVSGPANGLLALGADGGFTYTPAANFNGWDSFTYKASDGEADSNAATVTISIAPANDAPVAVDDVAAVTGATPDTIDVLANDTDVDRDALVVSAVTQGALGSVVNNGTDVTYTADNVLGSLRAQIGALPLNSGQKNSLLAKLDAAERSFERGNRTAGNNQLGALINELEAMKRSGRLDPAVADWLIAQVRAIQSGTVTDSFTYTVSDGHGGTDTAVVTVTVSL